MFKTVEGTSYRDQTHGGGAEDPNSLHVMCSVILREIVTKNNSTLWYV